MLSQISSSENIIPAFVEIVDIAGLVKVGKFHFKMKILKSRIGCFRGPGTRKQISLKYT